MPHINVHTYIYILEQYAPLFVTYRSFKGEIILPQVKENESRRVIGLLLKSLQNKTVVTK